jgi:hypothetical protein
MQEGENEEAHEPAIRSTGYFSLNYLGVFRQTWIPIERLILLVVVHSILGLCGEDSPIVVNTPCSGALNFKALRRGQSDSRQ